MNKELKVVSELLDILNLFVGNYCERFSKLHPGEFAKNSHRELFSRFAYTEKEEWAIIRQLERTIFAVEEYVRGDRSDLSLCHVNNKSFYEALARMTFNLKDDDDVQMFTELMYLRENLFKNTNHYFDPTEIDSRNHLHEHFGIRFDKTRYFLEEFKDEKNGEQVLKLKRKMEREFIYDYLNKIDLMLVKKTRFAENLLQIIQSG